MRLTFAFVIAGACSIALAALGCGARTELAAGEDLDAGRDRPDVPVVMRIDAGPPTVPSVHTRMTPRCGGLGMITWDAIIADAPIDCAQTEPFGAETWFELTFPAQLAISDVPQTYTAEGLGLASVIFSRCRVLTGECVRAMTGRVTVVRFAPPEEAVLQWNVQLDDGRTDQGTTRITAFCGMPPICG
ncbi:MAG: hypothetical protein K8H88_07200 [Sandaracinaceae bacterium]|nr:hypothetical protein [Sandaracinaceae bacterium]